MASQFLRSQIFGPGRACRFITLLLLMLLEEITGDIWLAPGWPPTGAFFTRPPESSPPPLLPDPPSPDSSTSPSTQELAPSALPPDPPSPDSSTSPSVRESAPSALPPDPPSPDSSTSPSAQEVPPSALPPDPPSPDSSTSPSVRESAPSALPPDPPSPDSSTSPSPIESSPPPLLPGRNGWSISPTPSPSPADPDTIYGARKSGLPGWACALISIGVAAVVVGLLWTAFAYEKRRRFPVKGEATTDPVPSNSPEAKGSTPARALLRGFPDLNKAGKGLANNPQIVATSYHAQQNLGPTPSNIRSSTHRFSYANIVEMTNNFDTPIGRGGSSTVYKGIHNNRPVAVKILNDDTASEIQKQFVVEVETLMKTRHKNLVPLVGYCEDGGKRIVVYEYMKRGSLSTLLTKSSKGELSWQRRLQIAQDAAAGLQYLHNGCTQTIVHRDVKASNILLDASLKAKIADFGLSRPGQLDDTTYFEHTIVVGTPGYMDPEYHATQMLTKSSDVYSFGVVLFQLITGKSAIMKDQGAEVCLTQWARAKLPKGELESIIDPTLRGSYHNVNSVWLVADLANRATEIETIKRPTVAEIVSVLEEATKLEVSYLQAEQQSVSDFSRGAGQDFGGPLPR